MKSIIYFILLLVISQQSIAQEYLGIWSYEKLNESAIPEDATPEAIAMLSNIFSSLKLDLREDSTFTVELMAQGEDGMYEVVDDVLMLSEKSSFQLIGKDQGLFKDGNAQVLLKRGAAITSSKTYLHLNKDSYSVIDYNVEDLIGKWTTVEVRGAESEESPETTEALLSSLSLTFDIDGSLQFNVFGINQEQTWKKGDSKGMLLVGAEKSDPKEYYVYKLNEVDMIVELKSTGTLVYLKKQ